MRKLAFISALMLAVCLSAQELNCTVTINSDQIEGSNKQVYETLKKAIEEYMSQNRWTNMTYAEKEKIECSMLIVVKEAADNMYKCEMTLQSRTYYFLYDLYRGFPSMHDRASAYWSEAVASAGSIVSSKPMPARCILDIGAAYTLGPVTLSIDIHNLLGTRHHRSGMNTSVIPQQGRWIIAAIAVGL